MVDLKLCLAVWVYKNAARGTANRGIVCLAKHAFLEHNLKGNERSVGMVTEVHFTLYYCFFS